ncbi:chromate transporter [Pseudomonas aeruginosa]
MHALRLCPQQPPSEFACQPPAAIPTPPSRCSSPSSLGCSAFGGPTPTLGYFRDEFVRRRGWLSEAATPTWVALCQFLPGPASSQVGMALGLARAAIPAPSPPGSVSPCPRRCCWCLRSRPGDAGARCCPEGVLRRPEDRRGGGGGPGGLGHGSQPVPGSPRA